VLLKPVHTASHFRIESEHPQTEDKLILNLEVLSGRQDRQHGGEAVDSNECLAILIVAQQHLQAASHTLDVIITLEKGINFYCPSVIFRDSMPGNAVGP
jgi:hypothetical protein